MSGGDTEFTINYDYTVYLVRWRRNSSQISEQMHSKLKKSKNFQNYLVRPALYLMNTNNIRFYCRGNTNNG